MFSCVCVCGGEKLLIPAQSILLLVFGIISVLAPLELRPFQFSPVQMLKCQKMPPPSTQGSPRVCWEKKKVKCRRCRMMSGITDHLQSVPRQTASAQVKRQGTFLQMPFPRWRNVPEMSAGRTNVKVEI